MLSQRRKVLGLLTSFSNQQLQLDSNANLGSSFMSRKFSSSDKPVRVVFDLDYVLISVIAQDKYSLSYIEKDSIVESCGYHFLLYPGWKELIKYVMRLSNNNLIFFSAGLRERNEDIIPKMLERVLYQNPSEYIRNHVKIFSRHNTLAINMFPKTQSIQFQPDGMWGYLKKDLRVAVGSSEISHTVLIDDDPRYVCRGQEKNIIVVNQESAEIFLPYVQKQAQHNNPNFKLNEDSFTSQGPKDFFLCHNKLFYAAGVLHDIHTRYLNEDRALIDILWEHHGFNFEHTVDPMGRFKLQQLTQRLPLYVSGLNVLREFNKDLCFLVKDKEVEE